MSRPTEVYEGDTLFLSRKVVENRHLLQPTKATCDLVGYMFVYWAQRYGEQLLALNVIGNHAHAGYGDPPADSPKLLCMAHHWIARILNQRYGRTGQYFFAPGPPRPARLLDVPTIESRLTYIVANAPNHGITPNSYSWPGLLFGPEQAGRTIRFPRPPELGRSKIFPPYVEYVVPPPDHLRHLSNEEIHDYFRELRLAFEAEQSRQRDGHFMGVQRALRRDPFSQPHKTKERGPKPFFIGSTPGNRAAAARARRLFLVEYDRRLRRFRDGERDSPWPSASWKLRKQYGLPPPA